MAVILTTYLGAGKPTVANSFNVWGDENNDVIDKFDASLLSNNFSEDSTNHSGLDFAYLNGRIRDSKTLRSVSASSVTLTDNSTNYIEVSPAGTVSANTTGFTDGAIPLFSALTVSGVITSVTDVRAYVTTNLPIYNDGYALYTTKDLKLGFGDLKDWKFFYNYIQLGGNNSLAYTGSTGTGSVIFITNNAYYDDTDSRWEYISGDEASRIVLEDGKIKLQNAVTGVADNAVTWRDCLQCDDDKNILINGASNPTSSVGAISILQGTDPTSSEIDQISLFATSGANATLGLRTEQAVATETDETKFSHKLAVSINGSTYYIMLTDS